MTQTTAIPTGRAAYLAAIAVVADVYFEASAATPDRPLAVALALVFAVAIIALIVGGLHVAERFVVG